MRAEAPGSAAAYWPARTSGWLATHDSQKVAAELVVAFAALENARLIASICLKASFLDAFLGDFNKPDLLLKGFFLRENEGPQFWAVKPEYVREVRSHWVVREDLVGLEASLAEQILEQGLPPVTAVIDVNSISLNSPAQVNGKIRSVVKWAEAKGLDAEDKAYRTADRLVTYADAIRIVRDTVIAAILTVGMVMGGNEGDDPEVSGGQDQTGIVCEFDYAGGGEVTDQPGIDHLVAVETALSDLTDNWRQELGAAEGPVSLKEMSTERVKALQKALTAVDIKLPKYGADGKIGDETTDALNSYADRYGLSQWDDNPGLLIEQLAYDAALAGWNRASP